MTVMQEESAPTRLLHVKEVAERLDVKVGTAYRLISAGELPAVKVGRCYRIHPDVVGRYFNDAGEAA